MRIFSKHGGVQTELVKPFDLWPESVRVLMSSAGQLSAHESPFLAFMMGHQDGRSILERIVWMKPSHLDWILLADLIGVMLSDDDVAKLSQASIDSAINSSQAASAPIAIMRQANTLSLMCQGGEKKLVEFEAGRQLFGFWNAINTVIRQSCISK
jgi:hypothetical protein